MTADEKPRVLVTMNVLVYVCVSRERERKRKLFRDKAKEKPPEPEKKSASIRVQCAFHRPKCVAEKRATQQPSKWMLVAPLKKDDTVPKGHGKWLR